MVVTLCDLCQTLFGCIEDHCSHGGKEQSHSYESMADGCEYVLRVTLRQICLAHTCEKGIILVQTNFEVEKVWVLM